MIAVAAAVVAIGTFALFARRSPLMASDVTSTKAEVGKRVPIGASIDDARIIMTREGFSCSTMKNQKFSDQSDDGKQIVMGPTDFLWCDSGDRMTRSFLITKRWQVIFRDEGGKVGYIGAGVGLTGP